ncbi:MAG: hybrid sensor histidine kinase/response regulator [Bryobacteraceae bacterium]|nr:hybrid sensor histidine kinase/response regulator [Bryobacteraceae bacterium]
MVDVAGSSQLLTAALSVVAASLVWWSRVRRLTVVRSNIAGINALSEEILNANTAEEAEKMAAAGLGKVLGAGKVRVILSDQALDAAGEAVRSGVAVERSNEKTLYLPMISGAKPSGAFAVSWLGEKCPYQIDERAALQHLANQIAITLELHDRRFQREQMLRGEKLGAAGRLIAAVAAELAEPLERISGNVQALRDADQAGAIRQSVASAKETLDRLLALGRSNAAELSEFDVSTVTAGLAEFRRRNWEMRSLAVTVDLPRRPVAVLGARGAFEHALLDLLVHAEQCAEHCSDAGSRRISIIVRQVDSEARIEIAHPAAGEDGSGALMETVSSIAGAFNGQARVDTVADRTCWVLTLPAHVAAEAQGPPEAGRSRTAHLTLLLADPNQASARALTEKLAQRGHRVVQAAGGGEAIEMATALRFNAVFATPALPDMSWVEMLERIRAAGCRVILLCDTLALLSHPLVQSGEATALRRPIDEVDLDRVLLLSAPAE